MTFTPPHQQILFEICIFCLRYISIVVQPITYLTLTVAFIAMYRKIAKELGNFFKGFKNERMSILTVILG